MWNSFGRQLHAVFPTISLFSTDLLYIINRVVVASVYVNASIVEIADTKLPLAVQFTALTGSGLVSYEVATMVLAGHTQCNVI